MRALLRVSLVQLGYADNESVAERTCRVADLVRSVSASPATDDAPHLVVLPELWAPTGFGYQAWEERAETPDGPTGSAMSALARDYRAQRLEVQQQAIDGRGGLDSVHVSMWVS